MSIATPPDSVLEDLVEFYKAFSDRTRLRVLRRLLIDHRFMGRDRGIYQRPSPSSPSPERGAVQRRRS